MKNAWKGEVRRQTVAGTWEAGYQPGCSAFQRSILICCMRQCTAETTVWHLNFQLLKFSAQPLCHPMIKWQRFQHGVSSHSSHLELWQEYLRERVWKKSLQKCTFMELFSGKTVYFGLTGQCKCQGVNIPHGEYLAKSNFVLSIFFHGSYLFFLATSIKN